MFPHAYAGRPTSIWKLILREGGAVKLTPLLLSCWHCMAAGPLTLLMEFGILAPAGKMDLRCTFAFLTWEHASLCYSDIPVQRGFSHTQPQAQLKPSENKHTNFWGLLMEMLFSPSSWQQRSCLCSTSFSCACHPHISCSFLLARRGGLNSGTDFNSQWINTGFKSNTLTVFPVSLGFL